jgi:hypothetical protein
VKNEVEQEFDVSEFKRLMHNQEVQINELQRKLSGKLDEDLLTTASKDALPKYEFHDDPPPVASGEVSDSAAPDSSDDHKDTPSR